MRGRFHRFNDMQKMALQFCARFDESMLAPPTYNAPPQSLQLVIRLNVPFASLLPAPSSSRKSD